MLTIITLPVLRYFSIPDDPSTVRGQILVSFNHTTRNPLNASAGAGLTHVAVFQPGYGPDTNPETFSDAVLEHYRQYFRGGLVRFMPWTLTGTHVWGDRVRVGAPSYLPGNHYGEQVPGEVLIPTELYKLEDGLKDPSLD